MFPLMGMEFPLMAAMAAPMTQQVIVPYVQNPWGHLSQVMTRGNISFLPQSLQQVVRSGYSGYTGAPEEYLPHFEAAAERYNLPRALLESMAQQESGFRNDARSRSGAQGIMQLMPATARELGVENPQDPAQNIDAGARYLRQQLDRFGGDYQLALAAYNAGAGNVRRHGGIPPFPETQNYVRNIMGRLDL